MSDQDAWHSQDAFWELVEPMVFNRQRLSSAQAEVEQLVTLLQIEKQSFNSPSYTIEAKG